MLEKIEMSKGFNKILQLSDNASELSLLSHTPLHPQVSNILFPLIYFSFLFKEGKAPCLQCPCSTRLLTSSSSTIVQGPCLTTAPITKVKVFCFKIFHVNMNLSSNLSSYNTHQWEKEAVAFA